MAMDESYRNMPPSRNASSPSLLHIDHKRLRRGSDPYFLQRKQLLISPSQGWFVKLPQVLVNVCGHHDIALAGMIGSARQHACVLVDPQPYRSPLHGEFRFLNVKVAVDLPAIFHARAEVAKRPRGENGIAVLPACF